MENNWTRSWAKIRAKGKANFINKYIIASYLIGVLVVSTTIKDTALSHLVQYTLPISTAIGLCLAVTLVTFAIAHYRWNKLEQKFLSVAKVRA